MTVPPIPHSAVVAKDAEDAAFRKIARRLIPFLFLLYMVAFIDRVNIGFAKLQMSADLGLSEAVYGVGAGIFFIGYFLFEIPSNFILYRVGAKIWIARIILLWGLISMGMMFVDSKPSFYVLRFLLGIGEAGFFPGMILYLTYWFPSRRRAKTTASFMTAIAVSGVIGGPVSGWIMETMDGWLNLRGWQWLFLVEGAPAVVLAFVSYFFLEDDPRKAPWLTVDEKRIVLQKLDEDQALRQRAAHHQSFRQSVLSGRVWLLALIYFLLIVGLYGVSFWLPQIVHDLDLGGLSLTGLLSAIPYLFAAVAMVTVAHSSDVRHERRWHTAGSSLLGGLGLIATGQFLGSPFPTIAGLAAATSGILAAVAVFWSLPTAFLSGRAAAGGIALINSFGGLGGYFGPAILGWVREATGSLEGALYGLAIALALAALIVIQTTQPIARPKAVMPPG